MLKPKKLWFIVAAPFLLLPMVVGAQFFGLLVTSGTDTEVAKVGGYIELVVIAIGALLLVPALRPRDSQKPSRLIDRLALAFAIGLVDLYISFFIGFFRGYSFF